MQLAPIMHTLSGDYWQAMILALWLTLCVIAVLQMEEEQR